MPRPVSALTRRHILTATATLSILDAETGEETEYVELDGEPTSVAAAYETFRGRRAPHGVYVGTDSGTLRRIGRADDLSRSISLGATVVTPPSVRGELGYVGTADGNLHVFGEVAP